MLINECVYEYMAYDLEFMYVLLQSLSVICVLQYVHNDSNESANVQHRYKNRQI